MISVLGVNSALFALFLVKKSQILFVGKWLVRVLNKSQQEEKKEKIVCCNLDLTKLGLLRPCGYFLERNTLLLCHVTVFTWTT